MRALLKLLVGECFELEEQATEILRAQRREIFNRTGGWCHDEINDWFDEDQWRMRLSREVYNVLGYVGEYLHWRNHCFNRAWADKPVRPSIRHALRTGMDPWRQYLWEQIDNWSYMPGHFVRRQAA